MLFSFALYGAYTGASDVRVVPCHHPAGKVIRSTAAAIGKAASVVKFACLSMIGIEKNLLVTVVLRPVDIIEGWHQTEGARIVDGLNSHIVCFLVVPLGIVSVRVSPGSLRIGGDVVWILQPPCVGQVCLGQVKTSKCFGCTSRYTSCLRQILYGCQKIRKNGFGVNLRNCIAD